jgi:hypothetical protein
MSRLIKTFVAATAGIGALLAVGCTSLPTHATHDGAMARGSGDGRGPGPQAGMLEQMRAHHRCIETEMAKRQDGGRAMPDKAEMMAMMERCPMPAAMRESMMMMSGGTQSGGDAPRGEHPHPDAPPAEH